MKGVVVLPPDVQHLAAVVLGAARLPLRFLYHLLYRLGARNVLKVHYFITAPHSELFGRGL